MSPLEIVLIIIGIIIIIVSCIIVDKSSKAAVQAVKQPFPIESALTEEDKKKLTDKINELLAEISEEAVIRTDDTLSKLSNEKIIAVNEFSEQILEKINRNHEEVVFLYNMLNDKEKELKAAVKEIDSSKKKVQDIMEAKASTEKAQAAKATKPQLQEKSASQGVRIEKQLKTTVPQADLSQDMPVINSLSSNNNTQILALYSQGKSVMEISKLLGLGQGEVKLVIDLYKGKK
jgi:hypothetical protein